jgi:hypothetical protein
MSPAFYTSISPPSGGTQSRVQEIKSEAAGSGKACPRTMPAETRQCNTVTCTSFQSIRETSAVRPVPVRPVPVDAVVGGDDWIAPVVANEGGTFIGCARMYRAPHRQAPSLTDPPPPTPSPLPSSFHLLPPLPCSSCKNRCGAYGQDCSCDTQCTQHGDCCAVSPLYYLCVFLSC